MRRGEIWWADLDPPSGRRPVLLLSRDEAYRVRELVIIAPVTTRVRGIPTEVLLDKKDGLPKACVANLDVLATIPKTKLTRRIASLNAVKRSAVDEAVAFALGLSKT